MRLHARSDGGALRVEGLVVPWDTEIVVAGRAESFAPHSLRPSPHGVVPLDIEHGSEPDAYHGRPAPRGEMAQPIGQLDGHESRPDGLFTSWLLIDTPLARNTWQLVAEGIYAGLSPMFRSLDPPQSGPGAQGRVRDAVMQSAALTTSPAYPTTAVARTRRTTRVLSSRQRQLLEAHRRLRCPPQPST